MEERAHGVATADLHRVVAIVPVGDLETAKSRLGGRLDAEERLALARRLLVRTVAAARGAASLAGIVVITPDPIARDVAAKAGADALLQRSSGLNDALREARDWLAGADATAVLILPIDLPMVTAAELDSIVARAREAIVPGRPLVAVVPDRGGVGTNVLLVAPPETVDFRFGPASRAAHAAAADRAGAVFVELASTLSLDIDLPEDLALADPLLVDGEPAADAPGAA